MCSQQPNESVIAVGSLITRSVVTRIWGAHLVQGTVGSTFFQQMWRIFNAPSELPEILGAAIPDSSNFFMQFIAMRSLFLVWLRLCIPHGGVWQNWLFKVVCPAACCSMCNTGEWVGGWVADVTVHPIPAVEQYAFAHMRLRAIATWHPATLFQVTRWSSICHLC